MPLPTQDNLAPLLTTRSLGRRVESHAIIDSTNRRAKILAALPDSHGIVVVADQQTAGRGRMTRAWQSPPAKNLYFSLILRPDARPQTIPQIALFTAVALHKAVSEIIPDHTFGLKWPNDLWDEHCRKLSGILCEAMFCGAEYSVVAGVGVNINGTQAEFSEDIRQTAGTLADIAGHPLERTRLLAAFLNHFEPLLDIWQAAGSLAPFMDYWNRFDILKGRAITVQCNEETITGTANGIQDDGMLILQSTDGTRHAIHAGDTHILNAR